MDKNKFKDKMGRPITQSLFLENGYTDFAVYTFKDDDFEYKGKTYPSLKRLYLEAMDPTEYSFATEHLAGWKHWVRLQGNSLIMKHIEQWREELELAIASEGVKQMRSHAKSGHQGSSRWLAERGWNEKKVGRPSKVDKAKKDDFEDKLAEEFAVVDISSLR